MAEVTNSVPKLQRYLDGMRLKAGVTYLLHFQAVGNSYYTDFFAWFFIKPIGRFHSAEDFRVTLNQYMPNQQFYYTPAEDSDVYISVEIESYAQLYFGTI